MSFINFFGAKIELCTVLAQKPAKVVAVRPRDLISEINFVVFFVIVDKVSESGYFLRRLIKCRFVVQRTFVLNEAFLRNSLIELRPKQGPVLSWYGVTVQRNLLLPFRLIDPFCSGKHTFVHPRVFLSNLRNPFTLRR